MSKSQFYISHSKYIYTGSLHSDLNLQNIKLGDKITIKSESLSIFDSEKISLSGDICFTIVANSSCVKDENDVPLGNNPQQTLDNIADAILKHSASVNFRNSEQQLDDKIQEIPLDSSKTKVKSHSSKSLLSIEQDSEDSLDAKIEKEDQFASKLYELLGQYAEYNPLEQNYSNNNLMGLSPEEMDYYLENVINQHTTTYN